MAAPLEELRKIRLEKLEKILLKGVNPFPSSAVSRQPIEDARGRSDGETVAISGRVRALRGHGAVSFFDVEDASGKIQIFFQKVKLKPEDREILSLLDIGDFIQVKGNLFTTKAGEHTIDVAELTLLSKSLRPLPSSWYGLSDIEERYRQRYVDLVLNPDVRNVFYLRSRIISMLREALLKEGFTEVETPVLQPLYGGAAAKPFTTQHNALDSKFYLRISDELYLKRLLVGGFERVFEIGKDFRNEGIDREHSPEFTMLEFYWAYSDYEELMVFTEKTLSDLVLKLKGDYKIIYQGKEFDIKPPWKRVTFRDLLLASSGIDINSVEDEKSLREEIAKREIKLDLNGVVGYGALLDALYKKVARPKIEGPLFITQHPFSMRPLAKKVEGDNRFSASFQLLVGGFEWVNAYNELNNPVEQKERWIEEGTLAKRGLLEYQVLDEDYLRALEYGMPPTAGWGMGVDRLVAFLADQANIKDVILFPALKPEVYDAKKS